MEAQCNAEEVLALFERSGRFEDYQRAAGSTAIYSGVGEGQVVYPVLGLLDESAEVAEKVLCTLEARDDTPLPADTAALPLLAMALASALGKLLGLLKKTWRDSGGTLDEGRLRDLRGALVLVTSRLERVAEMLEGARPGQRIALPALAAAVDDDAIQKELGDVLWYLARALSERRCCLGETARQNLRKLAARKSRGTLGGSGDER
jgi:NTP pyrophosphatase (non-canonical NTP hydrolase)